MRAPADTEQRATFLELFFDLVFVFAVTQLSHRLLLHLTVAGAAHTLVLLLVVWWAWIYTTWMTNWFDPDSVPVRVTLRLLAGMLASLAMAIAIPQAFGSRALPFAAGYVSLQIVRNLFIVAATKPESPLHVGFRRILAWSAWTGAIWIAGAVSASLWWLYFDEVARSSAADFKAAADDRGRLGRAAYTYLHVPIVAGVIVVAVGLELVVAHPGTPLHGRELAVLAVGPALYLAGHLGFRLRMIGTVAPKRIAAIAALAAAVLATSGSPSLVSLAVVVAVLAPLSAAETAGRLRPGLRARPLGRVQ